MLPKMHIFRLTKNRHRAYWPNRTNEVTEIQRRWFFCATLYAGCNSKTAGLLGWSSQMHQMQSYRLQTQHVAYTGWQKNVNHFVSYY